MEDVTLQNSDFYLAIYDLETFIKSKEANLSTSLFLPNLCLEWSSKQKFAATSSGYSSDSDEEEAEKSEYLRPLRDFANSLALSAMETTTEQKPQQHITPAENCVGSSYVNEEVAVILISCSNLITTSEELSSILNQLIPNLDNSSLLSIDSLYSISEKGISKKMINSLLSFIMRQTFDFIAFSIQQKDSDPKGLSGSSHSFDASGNWLMQSGYFEFWHGKKSVDLMAELLRLVEVSEKEIEAIKAGYREFSCKSDSLIIPLLEEQEDWELQDPEQEEVSHLAERLPKTLTQHQMLDHLAQKAQIVELKLDRIELLALREARQDPGLPLINDVEMGLTQQRNALQHLKSSFIITGDDLLSQGSHLFDFVIKNSANTNSPALGATGGTTGGGGGGGDTPLLLPASVERLSTMRRSSYDKRRRLEESYVRKLTLKYGKGVLILLVLILLVTLIGAITVLTLYFAKVI